ncbi:hypothetical protein LUZ62_022598 [Rhynchospora pubera]|uniref:Root cap n=1 Tax=Rhynchospora pubera TaxID=906938 RepID=A0AAV8H5K9_9POAL|nr:hypothetical protein LUZ62_022598 [Rhynchospora pubera]
MAAFSARPWMLLVLFSSGCLLLVTVSGADDKAQPPVPPYHIFSPGKLGKRALQPTCLDDNTNKTSCYGNCPSRCPNTCGVFCPGCKAFCPCDLIPGAVCGDPHFTGGDGNIFYFHGKKDQDFCILSDSDLHINAHFIGKSHPSKNRDFTWVQSLGILFGSNHRLYFGVEKTMTWKDDVDRLVITFDGERIEVPTELNARWVPDSVPALSITRTLEANRIKVELKGVFTIMAHAIPITEEDSKIHNYGVTPDNSLAHLDLAFKFQTLSENVHGVLGQTYRPDYVNRLDVTKNMPIMGGTPDYSSSSIFATDCAVARYLEHPKIAMVTEIY